jgi:hypothetical protein
LSQSLAIHLKKSLIMYIDDYEKCMFGPIRRIVKVLHIMSYFLNMLGHHVYSFLPTTCIHRRIIMYSAAVEMKLDIHLC